MAKNNKEYWGDRLNEEAQALFETTEKEMTAKINRLYNKMQKYIENEYYKLIIKLLEDNVKVSDIWTYSRYKRLQKQITAYMANIGQNEIDIITYYLEESLEKAYMNVNVPGLDFALLDEMRVKQLVATKWTEKHFSQTVWDNKQLLLDSLKKNLERSIVLGDSKDKAIRNIMRSCETSRFNAERVVRTELMHIINEGNRQRYKDNGVTKLMIYAAEDERTCETCGARHKTIIGSDDGGMYPPFHPQCRCTILPLIESLKHEYKKA